MNGVSTKLTKPSDKDIIASLRLARTKSVGPKTYDQLISIHGSAQNALDAIPDMAKKGGRKTPLKPMTMAAAKKELEALHQYGGQLLIKSDPRYPALLRHIADAPPVLSVKGRTELLEQTSIAFVGARNASINGKKLTNKIATELGEMDLVITSGLARGIDTAAHVGALSTGTIAVIAGGIDVIYPKENARLHEKIAEDGLLVAELPFGTGLRAEQFPRRNRIVSGISKAVVVVEAAKRSGSLITARQALEQGREVLAFPGSPLEPRAEGPNSLIKQGATLVTSAQDIYNAIQTLNGPQYSLFEKQSDSFTSAAIVPVNETQLDQARETIHQTLGYDPVSIDDLVIECQVGVNIILTCLLELELAGRLARYPGNKVALILD